MKRFDYQHLDGVTIEAEGPALRLDYSEPDQGGTRLMIQFRIPCSGQPAQLSGYAHDPQLREREISFADIPPRVLTDATTWIQEQIGKSGSQTKALQAILKVMT